QGQGQGQGQITISACNGEPPSTARHQREVLHARVAQQRDHNHQESGAYAAMAAMYKKTTNKLEVTQAQVIELNVRMAEMSVKLEEKDRSMAEMGIKLEEKDGKIHDLQNRMDAFVIQRDTEHDGLLTALAASREEARMLREEELDMQHPRKQVKSGLTHLHAGPSTAPLGKLPPLCPPPVGSQDKLWEKLHSMKRPAPSDSPDDIAQYLQHNEETEFKGIPLSMPDFDVNMRDVRGYRQVFSRVLTYPKVELAEKFHASRCLTRLLLVLAVPGRYTKLLAQQHIVVAPTAALTVCDWGQQPLALTDGEVCVLLAASGLTAAVADDSWQFCYRYLRASAARPDIYVTSDLLELWHRIKDATPPPGLHSAAANIYARSVPGKRKEHHKKSFVINFHSFRSDKRAGDVDLYLHALIATCSVLPMYINVLYIYASFVWNFFWRVVW
ncbi:hypothetical protein B0H14DRAFT_3638944, partial [Mycena olivaceomarginata]